MFRKVVLKATQRTQQNKSYYLGRHEKQRGSGQGVPWSG